jgi:hypothetical protein
MENLYAGVDICGCKGRCTFIPPISHIRLRSVCGNNLWNVGRQEHCRKSVHSFRYHMGVAAGRREPATTIVSCDEHARVQEVEDLQILVRLTTEASIPSRSLLHKGGLEVKDRQTLERLTQKRANPGGHCCAGEIKGGWDPRTQEPVKGSGSRVSYGETYSLEGPGRPRSVLLHSRRATGYQIPPRRPRDPRDPGDPGFPRDPRDPREVIKRLHRGVLEDYRGWVTSIARAYERRAL